MADRAFPKSAYYGGAEVGAVYVAGQEAEFVFGRGTQILPTLGAAIWGVCEARTVADAVALWFEFGFRVDAELVGNAAAGFTDPGGYFRLDLQQSTDLTTWAMGRFLPAAVPVVDNGDGALTYWARATVPVWWFKVVVDLSLTSNRYGKSIAALSIGGGAVSLPGYPYAMPADAPALQADLRAAGYAGAEVSSVPAALGVGAKNHTVDGTVPLGVTLDGADVTEVTSNGFGGATVIPLPGYPYAMPAARATLQTDLRAAGQSGAVVMLYGDAWTIDLPDRLAAGNPQRASTATIDPGDPYPSWDFFGTYLGEVPNTNINGTWDNVRAAGGGEPLLEGVRQFGRLQITRGGRYDSYL